MENIELREVDRLETHDRLLAYKKSGENIGLHVQTCIDSLPDGIKWPFYVWGHSRQIAIDERMSLFMGGMYEKFEDVPSERFIWMPRPSKPEATPNSFLFRANKGTDIIEMIWMLPKLEFWEAFEPGKMTHNLDIWTSILNFRYSRSRLQAPEPGDMDENQRDEFRQIIKQARLDKERYMKI